MARLGVQSTGPAPDWVSGRIAASSGKQQQGWPASRVFWKLMILFAALQIADVVTTNYALAMPGVWEANPLMALLQTRLGAAWWLPKVAVVGAACLAKPLVLRRWPMAIVLSYYGVIVSINVVQL
jgi:hypothetical protein